MRQFVKDEIKKQIDTLIQGVAALKFVLENAKYEETVDLLAQMQEMVIELGTWAEKYLGENHYFVKTMECVCELLYDVSQSIVIPDVAGSHIVRMKEIFAEVHSQIENECVKKEILFMPYQVSMWDSLESVWIAAKDDPELDCYVMPIPYYDVLPNGKLGQLHYDGNQYPHYVPITHYENYSIEERCPDMIFFHNPYDGNNAVTRVPEKYYSSYIRDYTGMLIYIPYMASDVWGPSEHQCYTPGVLFSDKVITQKGPVYARYCRGYTRAIKEAKLEHCFIRAEDKFIPLGSPKIDKLLNARINTNDLPAQWQRLLIRSDGTKKKSVLYNLSIGTLLENDTVILEKIKDTLQIFKNAQEDIILIWRPHPLLLNTINSMRPHLRDAYLMLIEQFKEGEWGIFDETPDPNLSMSLADAYYGDDSSLVTTFKLTGKPVMYQNMTGYSNAERRDYGLSFRAFSVKNETVWFSSDETNGLFRGNLKTDKVDLICKIKNEMDSTQRLYMGLVEINGSFILIPDFATEVAIYNVKTGEIKKIPLTNLNLNTYTAYSKFLDYYCMDQILWLIPYRYKWFVKINLQTFEMEEVCNWYDEIYSVEEVEYKVESYNILDKSTIEIVVKDDNGDISTLHFDVKTEKVLCVQKAVTDNRDVCGNITLSSMVQYVGDFTYQYNYQNSIFEKRDLDGNVVKNVCFTVNDCILKEKIWPILFKDLSTNVWWESDLFQLRGMLQYLMGEQHQYKTFENENVGEAIYRALIKKKET